jgi:hypothetical protein
MFDRATLNSGTILVDRLLKKLKIELAEQNQSFKVKQTGGFDRKTVNH